MRRRTLLAAAIISGCAMEMGCSATNGPSGGGISEGASDSQTAAIKRMELATGNAWSVSYDSFLGTPYHAAGSTAPLLKNGLSATQAALAFFAENKDVFGMEDPAAELNVTSEDSDEYGWRHANFQQHIAGVPVYGGAVLAHYDAEGALRSVGAHYVKGIRQLDVNPAIVGREALAAAIRDWKANFQATLDETKDFVREPSIELYVYDREGRAVLAWFIQVNIEATDKHEPAKMAYWIDAKTGSVIHKYNGLETVAGSGTDVTSKLRELEVSGSGSAFTTVDTTRATGKITTNNLNGGTSGAGTTFSATAATGPWDTGETAPHKGSGVGAHYYSEAVWDYYNTIHQRNSFDGKGKAMINRVHYSKNWANASWDSTYMNYGDGDGTQLKNLTGGFDVIAHELTHGVTEYTSKLAYTGEPGGLNEAMSDIFGNLAEHWLQPSWAADVMTNPNLAVGEDIGVTKPLRYMCAPKKGLSVQKDDATLVTASDDPHISSGVPNVAWCLMTIGGKHPSTGTAVSSGIGWDKSAKVWYLTQTKYLANMANATFDQAAKANSDAANELALTQNEKNIVQCAWIANKTTTSPATCGDTTGGDGPDGGTTKGDSGAPPPPPDAGAPDVRTDISTPPADVAIDRPTTIDMNVPETPTPQPDTVTPPVDATPDVPTTMPDATGGRGGSSGAGSGGGGTGGTGGTGGSTGGTGGATGGTGGATGGTGGASGTSGTAGRGTAGTNGGSGRGGSAGSGPSDPGCGCTVPGQSDTPTKSTLALAVGLVAAALSRRRRRNAA